MRDFFSHRLGSLSHLALTWRDAVDILVVAVLVGGCASYSGSPISPRPT